MLGSSKLERFQQLIENFSKEEIIWINGYLSGIVANGKTNGHNLSATNHVARVAVKKISLVYGTETGNAKRLATSLAAAAKKKGINLKLTSLDQYKLQDLASEDYYFVVVSTQGEGEPPTGARQFYEQIHQLPLKLGHLKYSVLALGDSSYPQFCKTGIDIDQQLEKLGGQRVVPLQKCDVDYEEDAQSWFEQILKVAEKQEVSIPAAPPPAPARKAPGKKIYQGVIKTNINLNDKGSNKQTFHLEIGTDEPVEYTAGDAIAILPVNKTVIVEQVISLSGADPLAIVETSRATASIEDLLTSHLNICYLLSSAVKKYAAIAEQDIPDVRIDLVDLLRIYPLKNPARFSEVIKILSPIAPRLYSISSSPGAHGDKEVHLTVSRHSFRVKEEQRYGLCSDFLGEQPEGSAVRFYIHPNRSFRLPENHKDVVMIGPGTGIAPFRAFLAERDAIGAQGRNWLFFGEQHFTTDFLYQSELQNYHSTGVLSKISLAFSRDQQQKLYVQHRIKEQAGELYDWIHKGASIFVSGTKSPNSTDIENSLVEVIEEQGKLSREEAKKFLKQLENEGRYEKDVY